MFYILNENCALRGWKNKPYCIEFLSEPWGPVRISAETEEKLSKPVEYKSQDSELDRLIWQGILVPCEKDAEISDIQKYHNYGCLHFDNVIFSITGRCNYKCMHCSVNAPNAPMNEIPIERICQMLDEMKECGLKNIVLIGGEPLIRKDFLRIVDEIIKRGLFVIEIFTNGSLVTDELLDGLESRNVRPLFMLSFDGVGFHDKMRGIPGAEERLYRSVEQLKKRNFDVSCNMCITRESIYSLWETIEKLSSIGVGALTVYPPVECGQWEGKADALGVTTELVGEEYPKVIEKFAAAGYPMDLNMYGMIFFSKARRKYGLVPKWRTWNNALSEIPACRSFTTELNISPEGLLSPCYALMSDELVRNGMPDLNKVSLKEALTDSAFTRLMELTSQDIFDHNSKCASCEFFTMCGGGCRLNAYKTNGDFQGYDPQMCYFFEHGLDQKFKKAVHDGTAKYKSGKTAK